MNVLKISKDGKYVNNFIATKSTAVQDQPAETNLSIDKKYLNRVSRQREKKLQRTQKSKHRSVQRKEFESVTQNGASDSVLENVLHGLVQLVRPTEVIRFVTALSESSVNDVAIKPSQIIPAVLSPEGDVIREAVSDLYVAVVSNNESTSEESAILVLKQDPPKHETDLTRNVSNRKKSDSDRASLLNLLPDNPHEVVTMASKLLREIKKNKKKSSFLASKIHVLCVIDIVEDTKLRLTGEGQVRLWSSSNHVLLNTTSVRSMWGFVMAFQRAKDISQSDVAVISKVKEKAEKKGHAWTSFYVDDSTTIPQSTSPVEDFGEDDLSQAFETESDITKVVRKKPRKRSLMGSIKEILSKHDIDDITMSDVYTGLVGMYGEWIVGEEGYSKAEIDSFTMRAVGQVEPPSKIIDRLYLGTEYNASHRKELEKLGVKLILNVTEEVENFFPGNFRYFNISLKDVPSADLKAHFSAAIGVMKAAMKNNETVFVHCQRGVSRSASIVIAYLMATTGMTYPEALKFAKSKRSIVKPNKGFAEQLALFEEELRDADT